MTGMILQTSPLKEYDRRVEILTRERGRISAFAQGARRPNSALSACTILFTFGTFTLYPGRDSYRLQSGSIQTQFGELAQDYDALCYCSYFGEMARYFTREGVEASRELMLLYVTLRAVMHGKMTLPLVRVIYELRLMLIEGEMVELFQCLHCGTKEVNTVYLQAGGLLCPACAAKDKTTKDAYPLSVKLRCTLHSAIHIDQRMEQTLCVRGIRGGFARAHTFYETLSWQISATSIQI